MARIMISIADIPRLQEEQPDLLTIARVTVYDAQGIPSVIRAYELERFLGLGFFTEPPVPPPVEVPEPPPYQLPPTRPLVRSFRANGGN